MAQHILENERLRVTVADAGAELIGVYDKLRQAERIWSGEKEIWNRHAPILFPFVGRVTGGRYRVGDREYEMKTQHGFARDLDFACAEAGVNSVRHCLTADEWTKSVYPWDFRLTVTHRLDGSRLQVEWTVENCGQARMYFSIGGHPAFLPPQGTRKEDCLILFPGAERLSYVSANPAGFVVPQPRALALADGRARYQQDVPDTWIFEDHQVKRVGIAGPDGAPYVMLNCESFPILAVWANPKGPFICLEPWFGRTDDEGFCGSIDQKKDVQALDGGERREIAYSIDFC